VVALGALLELRTRPSSSSNRSDRPAPSLHIEAIRDQSKHSGRHALSEALKEMGFQVEGQALNTAFKRFKEIADRKKQVTAMDLGGTRDRRAAQRGHRRLLAGLV
jgi:hypothetical protein